MDDEVVFRTWLFDEVLSHQSVKVIILTVGFSANGDTGITLGKAWPQNIAIIDLAFEAYNPAPVRDSIPFCGYTFFEVKFFPAFPCQNLDSRVFVGCLCHNQFNFSEY
jgi:hypothetical protein